MSEEKIGFKPGNMLYPVPAVLVACRDLENHINLFTVAWTGTVCTNPPMLSISVRPERYSYHMIEETGEFTVNLTNEALAKATDFCGVKSGRDIDKWKECHLTPVPGTEVKAPYVEESPVSIECRVVEKRPLGSHTLFLAEVAAVHCDSSYLDEKGTFHLEEAHPIVYSHGTYFSLGRKLGTFGYSVRKKNGRRKK
ncbi:MAG: flavin reductase family protein [Lachnospiraceae bacterium]|nr:flavin reductase family protein [Lachnospiraceae bacterium]